MQISLRSQLIAGTAAVVGASAIAMTPVIATPLNLPTVKVPSAAQVALTGFDSPISELLDTLNWVNYDLFNGDPANVDVNYPWEPYAGMLPEFIYTALPIISQMGYNGADYVNTSLGALNDSLYTLSEASWNLPGQLITATKQLFNGQFSDALATLTNAIVLPIQESISTLVGSAQYVFGSVATNIGNVAAALPGIVKGLANASIGLVKASFNAISEIAKQSIAAISGGNFELAWNTVVDGLLGPVGADGTVFSSLAGVQESLTIGPGLVPLGPGNGYEPQSLRMWGEQSQLTIATALGSTAWPVASVAVPKPAAAVSRAVSRAVAPAAAVAAATAAPAAGAPAGESDAAGPSRPAAGADVAAGATSVAAEKVAAEKVAAEKAPAEKVAAATSRAGGPKAAAKSGLSRKHARAAG